MQVVRNLLLLLIVLPLAVMVFMPKKELYYLLEKKLQTQNIVISGEVLSEGPLSLTILHPVFYVRGAPLATARRITLWSVLLYTKLDVEELRIAEGLPAEVSVKTASAIHSLRSPMKVLIQGESSLGVLGGYISLKERQLHLDVAEGRKNRILSKYLQKGEKGWYYESKF